MLIHARHYRTGQDCAITWNDGLIEMIGPPGTAKPDKSSGWVAPALFDLQINGGGGIGFSSPNLKVEDIGAVVAHCRRHGISAFCPTVITQSSEILKRSFATLCRARAQEAHVAKATPAFHLEGPYISSANGPRGAHALAHVRPPDWEEFCRLQDAAQGLIRLVTLAPELPGALSFIERLTAQGVVAAIGHTAASPAVIRAAVAAGARLSTHLGNGSHALLPRHENYLWEQLDQDGLWASLICDGCHLPPALVRTFLKVKMPSRLILTCDASILAGSAPGDYVEWEQALRVLPEGKIIVRDTGFLAGSWVFTDTCVARFLAMTGTSLATAIDMATCQPRELLGLAPACLDAGAEVDLMLFDWQPGGEVLVRELLCA
jgi:N-acetylglucosamine-6-phosphate deacetylase